jgi:hypothetical protein
MKAAALATSTKPPVFKQLKAPFSNFDYVEANFNGETAIRRLFSQARSHEAKSFVIEEIKAEGVVLSENREIIKKYPDYQMTELKRVSFWNRRVASVEQIGKLTSDNLIGYFIAKMDSVPSIKKNDWHVFESVFRKFQHDHNCVARQVSYPVKITGHDFAIEGVIYCQQNELNKACAQVALRSLCSLHLPLGEITYDKINKAAATIPGRYDPKDGLSYEPRDGLSVQRIRAVLQSFGLGFSDIDYSDESGSVRSEFPYQKLIYSGVESGAGALLGFKMATRKAQHHSIPFFGHTFNMDTWVANATSSYFKVGKKTKYLPSETWLSSFIGHDDNFGSNFCVPRLFLKPRRVKYALAILPPGIKYDGVRAETIGLDYLYSLKKDKNLASSTSAWVKRFYVSSDEQEVILRAISISKKDYINHLLDMKDWHGRRFPRSIRNLNELLNEHLWMVEISLPELFPINKRKLGEIILDATTKPSHERDYQTFLFARFPSHLFFISGVEDNGDPKFLHIPSKIESHTELYIKHQIVRMNEKMRNQP